MYENGGWVAMNEHYSVVQGATMVTSQTGHVEEPGYIGDVTTTLSGYHLNPDLPIRCLVSEMTTPAGVPHPPSQSGAAWR